MDRAALQWTPSVKWQIQTNVGEAQWNFTNEQMSIWILSAMGTVRFVTSQIVAPGIKINHNISSVNEMTDGLDISENLNMMWSFSD